MTEVRTTSSTGGAKGVKPERFSLIPTRALAWVARMYGRGAEKYHETPDNPNWRKGYEWSKSYDALMRHATQFWGGEDIDEETQLPHMAAVAFHALTILTFMEEHPEFDDRYKKLTATQRDEMLADLRSQLTEPPVISMENVRVIGHADRALHSDPGTDYAMRQARARNLQ